MKIRKRVLLAAVGALSAGLWMAGPGLPKMVYRLLGLPSLSGARQKPLWKGLKADRILVYKAKRQLHLLRDRNILKTYSISLGGNPSGHKEREGDQRTPEGKYTISGRNSKSQFHLSLRISYPNERDVTAAKKRRENPGGDIMIHGLPNDYAGPDIVYTRRDWTLGCIAVGNRDIEEIWQAVGDGTPIEIRP